MNILRFGNATLITVSMLTLPWLASCSGDSPGGATGGSTNSSGGPSISSGGSNSSGGAPSSGGAAVVTSGGASSSGGATTSGGASTQGGSNGSGGSNVAGATSGGSANGGSSGNANGGSSPGGQSSSGGKSASSGGSSSGGSGSGKGGSGGASGGSSGNTSGGSSKGGSSSGGASSGGSGGGSDPCNVTATLGQYAPKDEELLDLWNDYLGGELGTVTCATSAPAGTSRTITQTIFVPPGVTYDGKGETLKADATAMKCDLTAGEQAESQRPYFLLAPGANVKNVTVAYPGCEGIHMMGNNVLDNISWPDAGEDAASVRSYFPGGKITISNSDGAKAADKMFQFNAPCQVRIENFTGSDMGKLVRQNGGTEFELHIDLNNVNVTGVISAVVQSDSPLCYVRHHGLVYQFTGSGDKSDRVFRDVPPANVTAY